MKLLMFAVIFCLAVLTSVAAIAQDSIEYKPDWGDKYNIDPDPIACKNICEGDYLVFREIGEKAV